MRTLKVLMAVLVTIVIAAGAVGCSSSATSTTAATKQVKASIGTISNSVTGTASLDLAKTQDVVFEMAGTVDEIMVEESQSVTKGEVLATLDTSDWEDNIKTLETSLSTAQRNLNNKEYSLTKAKRVIETKEMSKKQAELNLLSAQQTLADYEDVETAQDSVDTITSDIAYAESARRAARLQNDDSTVKAWTEQISVLNTNLEKAELRLAQVLQGIGVSDDKVALQITQSVFAVEQAQKAVSDAQIAIEDAQVDVDNAQLDVNDAQSSVAKAQENLDQEKALNPKVTAPFDGFVISIKISGGDEIQKGTVAMQIADPNQFQASFLVSETDIFSIEVGQSARVEVDATGLTYPAEVTAIAPLATTSSGVVNYKVTAKITSTEPISTGMAVSTFSGGSSSGIQSGALSNGSPAGKTDNSTTSSTPAATVNSQSTSAGNILKQGLSASITIVLQEKLNVLTVPLRAVTTQGGKSSVQVVNGVNTETVTVTTGLSDDTNIEIVSGLSEGQTVIVKASTSSSSTFGPGGGGGMMMMP